MELFDYIICSTQEIRDLIIESLENTGFEVVEKCPESDLYEIRIFKKNQ